MTPKLFTLVSARMLVVALILATFLSTAMTNPVSAAGLSISPGNIVRPGELVTITTSGCQGQSQSWLGLYTSGAPNTAYSSWIWCPNAPWTFSAPTTPGIYQVRALGDQSDGDWFDDVFGTVTFEVRPEGCQDFTATMRYGNITVRDFVNARIPIPDEARQFLDRAVITQDVAYAQLKGNWCFENNQVTSHSIRPLQASITGSGPTGLFFSVQPVATGQIILESYGEGATRYRISQSTARVSFNNPAEVTLTIPGTEIGIKIPPGERAIYDMRMDTLLTGQGNADCAATAQAPCTVEVHTD